MAQPRKTDGRLSSAEQTNLARLARLNRDGAIAGIKARTTDAIAEYEMKMAAEFSYDQREVWADLMHAAKARVSELDSLLAEDCRRLGIPQGFRPSISLGWHSRGENASAQRRSELRRVMATRLAAIEKAAIEEVEAGYRKIMTAVLSATLTSGQAAALLATMPSPEQLMPQIDYHSVKQSLLAGPEAAILRQALALTNDGDADARD
jgi:hypothetical protein